MAATNEEFKIRGKEVIGGRLMWPLHYVPPQVVSISKTLHQGMIAFCFGDLKLVQVHIQIVVLVYILFSQLYN